MTVITRVNNLFLSLALLSTGLLDGFVAIWDGKQARRVDSVEGVLLCFGRYFLAPEARASRGVWGHAPP